ncbi:hypothetical protein Q9966_003796 [Columba livia]|nr:hypothetical protein Q9966_003796 [Columba livia]
MPGNERVLGRSTHESRRLERPAQIVCGLRISLLHRFISDYQTERKFLPDDMRAYAVLGGKTHQPHLAGKWGFSFFQFLDSNPALNPAELSGNTTSVGGTEGNSMFLGNTNSPQPSCTTPYRSPGACGEQQWGCLAWHPQTIGPTPKVKRLREMEGASTVMMFGQDQPIPPPEAQLHV